MDTSIISSPVKDLDDCDNVRLISLYAPFRDRSLNPQGWDSKFSFWSSMIFKWCEGKNRVSFTLDDLNKDFMRNGRVPECLLTVLEELQRTKCTLQPTDFMNMCHSSDTWKGWMFDMVVKKTVSWTFSKIKTMVISPTVSSQTQFVHLAAIKQICETIFSSAKDELRGELIDIQTLLLGCNMQTVPSFDAMLIAYWLQYQSYAAVVDQSSGTGDSHILIKLRETTTKKKPTVSDVDLGIYTLSCNQKTLMHYIEQLEKEKQDAVNQAKTYLAKGMRSTAKSCLRKKKELEKVIEKRANALDNVQVLLARIRDASSDGQVLESYQVGVSALKRTFKEAGLTEDDVANTMDEVREVLDTHNEIQSILAEPVDSNTDEGLEEELAELLSEENAPGSGTGGGLDDSTSDLQDRLQQLLVNDSSPRPEGKGSSTLPETPKTITLADLPDAPRNIPTPESTPL